MKRQAKYNYNCEKFEYELSLYASKEKTLEAYTQFVNAIRYLNCDDFRWFYYLAHYDFQNKYRKGNCTDKKLLKRVQAYIDKSIRRLPLVDKENNIIQEIYFCAGCIYAELEQYDKSKEYFVRSNYYDVLSLSDFNDEEFVSVYSFRRYNEYSLSDLINNTITVSPSTKMNDPFDSLINLWASEEQLKQTCVNSESKHITPLCKSFKFFRVRSFCIENDKLPVRNILMWSHYAGEHTGFCIKYKLSNHFNKTRR